MHVTDYNRRSHFQIHTTIWTYSSNKLYMYILVPSKHYLAVIRACYTIKLLYRRSYLLWRIRYVRSLSKKRTYVISIYIYMCVCVKQYEILYGSRNLSEFIVTSLDIYSSFFLSQFDVFIQVFLHFWFTMYLYAFHKFQDNIYVLLSSSKLLDNLLYICQI